MAETLPDGRFRLDHRSPSWDRARGLGGGRSGGNLTLGPFCADSGEVDNLVAFLTAVTALVVALAALVRAAHGPSKGATTKADVALRTDVR